MTLTAARPAEEDAGEIHVDHALPVLVGQLPDREGATGDPRVVDQDVQPAPPLHHAGHRVVHVAGAGDIRGQGERAASDRPRRRLHRGAVLIEQGHPRAVGGEPGGDRQPDAPGGAGHERDLLRRRHR
jgi:hypothetical protein